MRDARAIADGTSAGGWLSAHLMIDGDFYGLPGDRAILDCVEPVARECLERGWARRFFFIRYSEDGPHVRFRLQGRRDDLDRRARPLLARTAEDAASVRALVWKPYEREVERYGGPRGVEVAEAFFHHSSEIALRLLPSIAAEERAGRLGKAMLAMLVLLHVFVGSDREAARLIRRYGERYLRQQIPDRARFRARLADFERGYERQASSLVAYVEAAWQALAAGETVTAEMDDYRRRLRGVERRLRSLYEAGRLLGYDGRPFESWREASTAIFPSYLHMMSNRLGTSVQEECYLAIVASATLRGEPALAAT